MEAKKGHYGVTAPNVMDSITVEAAFKVADKLKAPMIIDRGGQGEVLEAGADFVAFYAKKYPNVVATLNLDHGGPFEAIMLAIRCGFNSVMIDRSTLPFEENVKEVAEVVKVAHALGVSVEAELGHVGQGIEYEQTRDSGLTNPDEAVEYVKRTGVDCLAVSIGTSHGVYKGTPYLDFPLLEKLVSLVDIPLVLHGGSGTGDDNLQKAVENGIQKVNLATDLVTEGGKYLKDYISKDGVDIRYPACAKVLMDGYAAKLSHYVELFHAVGKAAK